MNGIHDSIYLAFWTSFEKETLLVIRSPSGPNWRRASEIMLTTNPHVQYAGSTGIDHVHDPDRYLVLVPLGAGFTDLMAQKHASVDHLDPSSRVPTPL
ncbi:hypothetical protein T265_11813 [Opisthorchis viverrini]|uniref:Uncharacterized protein n=1 Tax=Opisthorchis viverrini TaxID=6198 RepID=A0A074ZW34_OPIVI|nr:hypothetical protein T265_11813 [Opisthorchis viverrini]KER19404.1 hypothetical protein T265_11813 [Opisthorchis viverrini]